MISSPAVVVPDRRGRRSRWLLTPLLLVAADRWWIPILAGQARRDGVEELNEPQSGPVIIAGFGRYGQIVGRMLFANGIAPTVLDHDAEAIEALRKFGWRVHYGDATRLDLMRTAGADRARVIVVAIDDIEQSVDCARMIRENFPTRPSSPAPATSSTTTSCTSSA